MKISKLIKRLEKAKEEHGDIDFVLGEEEAIGQPLKIAWFRDGLEAKVFYEDEKEGILHNKPKKQKSTKPVFSVLVKA